MSEEEEMEIQHRIVMEEDNIKLSELPDEIRQAIRNFNQKLKRYENGEDEDNDLYYELKQDDVAIADDITTWIEDNESEENDEDDSYNKEEENQQQAQNQQQPTISDLEKKVRESLKNGLISVEDLESILKREPDYPNEQIGSLKLRKQYLKPFYEAI